MTTETKPPKHRSCSRCGHAPMQARLIDERYEFRFGEERVLVEARGIPVEICESCGERYSGPEAARVHHDAICQALGLLSPDEIRQTRERLEMTQLEFARFTGVSPETIERWERGRLLPDRALDNYLRLLNSDMKNIQFLQTLGSRPVSGNLNGDRSPSTVEEVKSA